MTREEKLKEIAFKDARLFGFTANGFDESLMNDVSFLISELKLAWAREKQFKIFGTDGCTTCESGRITLFTDDPICLRCHGDTLEKAEKMK